MQIEKNHNSGSSNKLLWGYLVFIFAIFFAFGSKMASFGKQFFQLTEADTLLIPVGSFLFIIFWLFNKKYFFSSALKLIEARENATVGNFDRSNELNAEADKLFKTVLEEVKKVQLEASKNKDQIVEEAKNKSENTLKDLTAAQKNIIDQSRVETQKEAVNLQARLESQIDDLAKDITSRLLNCNIAKGLNG